MAAGVTDWLWEVANMVDLLKAWEPQTDRQKQLVVDSPQHTSSLG
jgi:hypothetical protein